MGLWKTTLPFISGALAPGSAVFWYQFERSMLGFPDGHISSLDQLKDECYLLALTILAGILLLNALVWKFASDKKRSGLVMLLICILGTAATIIWTEWRISTFVPEY